MHYAPIALFAYNRLAHVTQTVQALLRNPEARDSELYVFSDAANTAMAADPVAVVRHYLHGVSGFAAVHVIERPENYGLARSIIDGVTRLCERYGRVIVVEDDLVTSPHFLRFMNDGLNRYEHVGRVISIHGYQYPVTTSLPETFFLRGADCWGWATWKRGWDLFEANGRLLLRQLKERKLTHRFDFDGAYPYTRMLKKQIEGKNNSWAIRWHASAFLRDKLTLYPGRSLVRNIGTDNSGTHCSTTGVYTGEVSDTPIQVDPIRVEEHAYAKEQIAAFHKASRPSIPMRILRRLTSMTLRPL